MDDKEGETEKYGTEKILRMDTSYICYALMLGFHSAPEPPQIKNGHITLGMVNGPGRHSEESVKMWQKCLDEINAAFPDRNTTYEGEAEFLEARRKWSKLDTTARRILRFMDNHLMKLSEFMASGVNIEGRAKARVILTEYCLIFPDRIDNVLMQFEDMQDTSDKFYILLKLANDRKQAISQGLIER
jgi:hypothetical protein